MMADDLVTHFSAIDDPRCAGKVEHHLMDVLVIAVCATIAGSESWEDMALYGRSKEAWLRDFLPLAGGIPSHDTFRRVFMLIDPDAFARCFTVWSASLRSTPDREIVAIDGKSLRRSFAPVEGLGPLHIVSAWTSERGLALRDMVTSGCVVFMRQEGRIPSSDNATKTYPCTNAVRCQPKLRHHPAETPRRADRSPPLPQAVPREISVRVCANRQPCQTVQ